MVEFSTIQLFLSTLRLGYSRKTLSSFSRGHTGQDTHRKLFHEMSEHNRKRATLWSRERRWCQEERIINGWNPELPVVIPWKVQSSWICVPRMWLWGHKRRGGIPLLVYIKSLGERPFICKLLFGKQMGFFSIGPHMKDFFALQIVNLERF
jgi:hypothetical protein